MEEQTEVQNRTERMRAVVRAAMQRGGASQAVVARQIGVSGSTLSQWLSASYAGNSDAVADKVAAWDANRQAGAAINAASTAAWVDTTANRQVEDALLFAQEAGAIAVVYGGAGLGKTTAVKRYAERNPNVWRVTATPATSGLMAMLEGVASALELRDIQNRPSAYASEIVRRLTGTRGLLVVDEAQHVGTQALEELRSIHDAAGVGLVMVGNESVYARLTGGNRKATFAQLFSRVAFKLRVGTPTRADTDAILTAWGVDGAPEREWAHQVATLPGGLRGLAHTLRQARMFTSQEDGAVDLRALQAAWRNLGGEA
jgi:DNA transposition AAA+ family ATPase